MDQRRIRFSQLAIAIICSLGLMSTPVECALSAGPHSIYHTPKQSGATPVPRHEHSSIPGPPETGELEMPPGSVERLNRVSFPANADSACLDPKQSAAPPTLQLAQVIAPAEGSSTVSVTNREATVVRALKSGDNGDYTRWHLLTSVGEPHSDAVIVPDTPPPQSAT